jgi:hypothetical protein
VSHAAREPRPVASAVPDSPAAPTEPRAAQ